MAKRKTKLYNTAQDFYDEDDYKPTPRYSPPVAITPNHKLYHRLCRDRDKRIVICDGYAGTGKTIVAAYYAVQALMRNDVSGIIVTRSLEGVGRNPGAYKGGPIEKNLPKLGQVLSYISAFSGCDVNSLLQQEKLTIQGLYDIQGADYTGQYLIVTECQTLTAEQTYQLVTRGAEKIILEGDSCRAQLTNHQVRGVGDDGLSFLMQTIGDLSFVGRCQMTEDDIVRQNYIRDIIIRMMPALEALRSGQRV